MAKPLAAVAAAVDRIVVGLEGDVLHSGSHEPLNKSRG